MVQELEHPSLKYIDLSDGNPDANSDIERACFAQIDKQRLFKYIQL